MNFLNCLVICLVEYLVRSKWLHRKNNKRLILFCNGWGMDEHPFVPLTSREWNVLMFYDYSSSLIPDLDLYGLFKDYREIVLVSWSMGVWVGQQLFSPFREDLKTALAVNGTLCPVDDQYGIPVGVALATMDSFDEQQRGKFYHRMCRDRDQYRLFLENQPARSVGSQQRELVHLLKIVDCDKQIEPVYNCALVGNHDYIVPTANQLNFWSKQIVRQVNGYHFLFYAYKCWDELIVEAEENVNGTES